MLRSKNSKRHYFSIDSILATEEQLPCSFLKDENNIGFLEPGNTTNKISVNTTLQLPFWIASCFVPYIRVVTVDFPKSYKKTYRDILKADPTVVDLRTLSRFYYVLGQHLSRLHHRESQEMKVILTQTFRKRFRKIMDWALNGAVDQVKILDLSEMNIFEAAKTSQDVFELWLKGDNNIIKASSMGRCRVCGKIFCCSVHQKKHEQLEHKEYSKWLNLLPLTCRACHRVIITIYDLKTTCFQINEHRFISGNFNNKKIQKLNRKRRINLEATEIVNTKNVSTEFRKKLIPTYRLKKKDTSFANLYVINLNRIQISDAATNAIISPSFNVPCKILSSDAKTSTPLNEDDKENLQVVSVSVDHDAGVCTYRTPEMQTTSMILMSTLKEHTIPINAIMQDQPDLTKNLNRHSVTFSISSPNVDVSVYSTPEVTMNTNEKINFCEESFRKKPSDCRILTIVKAMRMTLNGIPRSLTNVWDWTLKKLHKKKKRDDFSSPVVKRRRLNILKRRPISSYWVNMSVSALSREPLPHYLDKYSSSDVYM
ncbi:hypothetical protein PGB90_008786 [Kerria lacca]